MVESEDKSYITDDDGNVVGLESYRDDGKVDVYYSDDGFATHSHDIYSSVDICYGNSSNPVSALSKYLFYSPFTKTKAVHLDFVFGKMCSAYAERDAHFVRDVAFGRDVHFVREKGRITLLCAKGAIHHLLV